LNDLPSSFIPQFWFLSNFNLTLDMLNDLWRLTHKKRFLQFLCFSLRISASRPSGATKGNSCAGVSLRAEVFHIFWSSRHNTEKVCDDE
jgi:hypothetical protein